MSNFNRYPLPTKAGSNGEPRVLGTATINLPGNQQITFACTHLDALRDSVNRELQMNAITTLLKDSPLPVIIAGDFNSAPGSKAIRLLDSQFKRTCDPCGLTFPQINPRKAIDFIAYSNENRFRLKTHRVIHERYASDHLPVMATIELRK